MRRHLLGLAAGATLLLGTVATAGAASAQDTDPVEPCTDARAALAAALDNVDAGLSLDLGLDALSDRLAALDLDANADARAALALVADVRTACDGQDDQDATPTPTPEPTPEPGNGDADTPDDGTPPPAGNVGETCSTTAIPSGIVGTDGQCIGATADQPATSGQVGTVPLGHADTGAL